MWELDYKESWALKNWCFWTVVLEKTLKSPLDCKIQPVHPKENKSWIFTGRTDVEAETPILWPPDAKNRLIWKDSDAGKDGRLEKKGTEDEMVGWHHQLLALTQTHVHQVGGAIQLSHPLSSPSPPPFNLSFPASGSFQMSQLFKLGGQSIGASASASVLPVNIQDWFLLGWTGWISLQ